MGDEKILELLIQLVHDMSFVKAKLSSIEDQKFASRIDELEAKNREHDKTIKTLERRNDTMEQFVRSNINESKNRQTDIFISMGLAVFGAVVGAIITMFITKLF